MNTFAEFLHKFGSQPRELKIGQSFFNDTDEAFHTIRYDFLPASIDPNKTSAIDFGQNGKVTITVPNIGGSGTTESVYQGQKKSHQKECVLIINDETGDIILERLNQSIIVKKARLRQEDLTKKSISSNKTNPSGFPDHSSLSPYSSSSSTNGNGTTLSQKSNTLSDHVNIKKPLSQKNGQSNNLSMNSKLSPNLPNGNSYSNNKNSATLTRSNGTKSSISSPSMPLLKPSTNSAGKTTSMNDKLQSDWTLKLPDPPEVSKKTKLQQDNVNDKKQRGTINSSSTCLSELSSSSDSSDLDDDSQSDHLSDSDNEINRSSNSKKRPKQSEPTALSMPSLIPTSANNTSPDSFSITSHDSKKHLFALSDDSDSSSSSSSDDDDFDDKDDRNSEKSKSAYNSGQRTKGSKDAEEKMEPVQNRFPSMPKFSQLSQDLQLSESDSDD
ncbi:Ell-associated factor Eaf [Sarcoptes scabiei]|uniref:Ell-associated factor Eaf n=1 Tax=Sarcoptes scabiei TaxID=52283 RepID=A0A834R4H5_SARSC|nr:Ell-associated factor Eaf [Sarcoptes scabiei]